LKIIPTREGIKQVVADHRCSLQTVGLVPTMGALHQGHLSLVKQAKQFSDVVVVSIFVNPTQFNNPTDLERYPRTLEQDLALLEEAGVDYVFVPQVKEMYPEPTVLKFDFGRLESTLEGEFRPGHFNGVGIIVCKLFHIIHPTQVYFGQKDLQQVAVIKRLIRDLSFDLEIIVVPTLREQDGLAMSSRNTLLSAEARGIAPFIYKSLSLAKDELLSGANWFEVKKQIEVLYQAESKLCLEYLELVQSDTMEIVHALNDRDTHAICTACHIGEIRLIDNLIVA
jgi:pantoate--beta-alanine ligase